MTTATQPAPGGPLRPGRVAVPAGLPRQVARFAAIGVVSTLAYLALFWLLRPALGPQLANVVCLTTTAVANTAANRRVTFGIIGRRHAARHHAQGLLVFGLGLALTSGSLAVLHAVTAQPARWVELAVLTLANAAATLLRFVLLRLWFHHRRQTAGPGPAADDRGDHEGRRNQAGSTVDGEYAGQTRAAPVVGIGRRVSPVEHEQLGEGPNDEVEAEQPGHSERNLPHASTLCANDPGLHRGDPVDLG